MRSSTHAALIALVLVALLVLVCGVAQTTKTAGVAQTTKATDVARPNTPAANADCVQDASGTCVAVGAYRRIASCSTIADAVLPDLVEPERVVATTRQYFEHNALGFRWANRAHLEGPQQIELLLALHPDLVLVSEGVQGTLPIRRLRERGLRIFDLGPTLGQAFVAQNMRALGRLLSVPDRGERLATSFRERLERIAAKLPAPARKRAMYVELYDTQLYGGTVGSSYHDVLTHAGLIDVAAAGVGATPGELAVQRAWPHYRPEDLLLLDPDVLVTTTGKTRALCNLPGLHHLRACETLGIFEFESSLIGDPGPGMLVAAEELYRRVYGTETYSR